MRAHIGVQTDYPVISIINPVEEHGPRGERAPLGLEIRIDDELLKRYQEARAEWVEVQRILNEKYGDEAAAAIDPRIFRAGPMRRGSVSAEWLSDEQQQNWDPRMRKRRRAQGPPA